MTFKFLKDGLIIKFLARGVLPFLWPNLYPDEGCKKVSVANILKLTWSNTKNMVTTGIPQYIFISYFIFSFIYIEIRRTFSETLIPRLLKACVEKLKEPQEELMQYFGMSFVTFVGKKTDAHIQDKMNYHWLITLPCNASPSTHNQCLLGFHQILVKYSSSVDWVALDIQQVALGNSVAPTIFLKIIHSELADVFAPNGVTGSEIISKIKWSLITSSTLLLFPYCLKFSMMSPPKTP